MIAAHALAEGATVTNDLRHFPAVPGLRSRSGSETLFPLDQTRLSRTVVERTCALRVPRHFTRESHAEGWRCATTLYSRHLRGLPCGFDSHHPLQQSFRCQQTSARDIDRQPPILSAVLALHSLFGVHRNVRRRTRKLAPDSHADLLGAGGASFHATRERTFGQTALGGGRVKTLQ